MKMGGQFTTASKKHLHTQDTGQRTHTQGARKSRSKMPAVEDILDSRFLSHAITPKPEATHTQKKITIATRHTCYIYI